MNAFSIRQSKLRVNVAPEATMANFGAYHLAVSSGGINNEANVANINRSNANKLIRT